MQKTFRQFILDEIKENEDAKNHYKNSLECIQILYNTKLDELYYIKKYFNF